MSDPVIQIISGERFFEPAEKARASSLTAILKKPIAIYGIGECAHWFHEIGMKRLGIKPVIALDRAPPVLEWCGVKTSTVEECITQSQIDIIDLEIIVCVGSRSIYNTIRQSLRTLGCTGVHFLHDLYEFHSFFVLNPEEVPRRIKKNPADKLFQR